MRVKTGAPVIAALLTLALALPPAGRAATRRTLTPIKHVILIIGENRTFDHLFATYRPRAARRCGTSAPGAS
ncbi:MAG: hypothetical protein ACREV7_14995 [Steroidobacteraceae bacterium]